MHEYKNSLITFRSQLLPPEVDINTSGQDDVLRFILRGQLLNCDEAMYWPFIVNGINFPTTRDFELDYFVKKMVASLR